MRKIDEKSDNLVAETNLAFDTALVPVVAIVIGVSRSRLLKKKKPF